jgi:hypothetical protein
MIRTMGFMMDLFSVVFLISAVVLLVISVFVVVTAMLRIRGTRRARLQMKRHLQRLGTGSGIT